MEKKCKKAKWLSEEALQIAVKRREAKSKGEKERYSHLNAEFQRITRRDKKAFLSDQYKEIAENNRMGKTRKRSNYHTFELILQPCRSVMAQVVKCLCAIRMTRVRSLGWEDPLEKKMATHSSVLVWRLPWTEKPGRL